MFGQMQEIELKADGANVQVTEQNKVINFAIKNYILNQS